nr:hypothetical protein [Streptomyces sp. ISL-10]
MAAEPRSRDEGRERAAVDRERPVREHAVPDGYVSVGDGDLDAVVAAATAVR